MRARFLLIVLFICLVPPCLSARGLEHIIDSLEHAYNYKANLEFEIWLPSSQEPVRYTATMQSDATPADSLSPCRYVIAWQSAADTLRGSGFSAYFDGHHYRLRDRRLQEYHFADSPETFAPGGAVKRGVQQQAQFASFLPQIIAHDLSEIETDSACTYNIKHTGAEVIVEGESHRGGYTGRQFCYTFSPVTLLPVKVEITYNPASVSEQTIVARYSDTQADPAGNRLYSEQALTEMFPEAFVRYRSSTFRANSLTGEMLPAFTCRIAGSERRFSRSDGDELGNVSIFVFLDTEVASTRSTIAAVRTAAGQSPVAADIYWVFPLTNHNGDIADAIGQLLDGETALSGAREAAAACGVTLYPTIIICRGDSKVKDVIIGSNNNLETIVLQKILLIK